MGLSKSRNGSLEMFVHFFVSQALVLPFLGTAPLYFGECPASAACGLRGVGFSVDKEWHPFGLGRPFPWNMELEPRVSKVGNH